MSEEKAVTLNRNLIAWVERLMREVERSRQENARLSTMAAQAVYDRSAAERRVYVLEDELLRLKAGKEAA